MFFNTFILSLKLKSLHVIVPNTLPLLSSVMSIGSFCNSFVLSPKSIPEEVLKMKLQDEKNNKFT